MISLVKGVVACIGKGQIELELNLLSLNLSLLVPNPAMFEIGKEYVFYTHMHWNQEQGPSLFGFKDRAERILFTTLIGCSGIGPKMALALLEQLGTVELVRALQQQDLQTLSSVSGIGNKKAEQIAVQLRHKVDKLLEGSSLGNDLGNNHWAELRAVLTSLSYSTTEVGRAMEYLRNNHSNQPEEFDTVLRRTLLFLSKSM